ncbi:hypothetical protein SCYAM73S_04473 [Streptomyces cyaneofuscatus]
MMRRRGAAGPIAFACSQKAPSTDQGPLVSEGSALAVDLAAYGLVFTRGTPPRTEGCRTAGRGLVAVTHDLAQNVLAADRGPRNAVSGFRDRAARTCLTRCWPPPSAPVPAGGAPESMDSAAFAIPAAQLLGERCRSAGPRATSAAAEFSSTASRTGPGLAVQQPAGHLGVVGRRPRRAGASTGTMLDARRPAGRRSPRGPRRPGPPTPGRWPWWSARRGRRRRGTPGAELPRSAKTPATIGAIRGVGDADRLRLHPGRVGAAGRGS